MDFLKRLFSGNGFMPHGHCYLWNNGVLGLHILSDALIALAYFSIPCLLIYFTRKRKDLPFNWIYLCFATFIVACGLTHIMEIWVIWHPSYWLSGGVKAVTAGASLTTAVLLVKIVPRVLALPTHAALRQATSEAQAELVERRKAEQKFRGLLEAAPDAIVIIDSQGRIVFTNSQTQKLFGYPPEELLNSKVERLIPARFGEHHPGRRDGFFAEPRARAMGAGLELFGLRKDGVEVPVEISLSPLETEDGRLAISAIRDISERKQIERVLQDKNLELQAAMTAKNRFLANMSHELRTPLNGIIGFSEFLVDEKPGALNAKQKEYLNDVLNSSRHLLQLINDVLDLAKVDAGKFDLRLETFRVDDAIREVNAVIKSIAQKKRIAIHAEVSPELTPVTLDPQKLKQILYNLLSNAVKFTPAGGRVEIEARPLDAETFRLAVKDTGIGIRSEDIGRLFQEFEQLESGEARRFEGTGLGLALTKRIVELQGGTISVESAPGSGSTFVMVLPRNLQGERPQA